MKGWIQSWKKMKGWKKTLVGERVWDSTKNPIQVMRPEKAVGRGDVERVKLAKYQIFREENKRL